ncbi:MAG: hypothetical protein EBV15_10990, partial [Bacteroidetes bacterium]|nr:hypothetical protein [Bacteroidota bacterium]
MLLYRIRILIVISIFPMVACTTMGKIAYGYKDLERLDERSEARWKKRISRQQVQMIGTLDSSYMVEMMNLSRNKQFLKAMGQFIVVMAYDSNQCMSISSNCYFGGFPNLNWKNGTFDSFPFRSAIKDSICRRLKLPLLLKQSNLKYDSINYVKNYIVVLSGNSLIRQTRRLIKTLNKDYPQVNIIVLNNDNALYYLFNRLP